MKLFELRNALSQKSSHFASISLTLALLAMITLITFYHRHLDDLDSVNFLNTLEKGFAPQRGLPHPPGYFSYVFIVRMLSVLTGDFVSALVWTSILSASLTLGILFDAVRRLHNPRAALLSVLLTWCTPVFLLSSLKALSDIPGVLGVTFVIWALSLGHTAKSLSTVKIVLLSFVGAWLVGIRPQSFAGLAIATVFFLAWKTSLLKFKVLLAITLGVLSGAALWLFPMLASFSWDISALLRYWMIGPAYIASYESLPSALSYRILQERLGALAEWLRSALSGTAPSPIGEGFIVTWLVSAFVGIMMSARAKPVRMLLAIASLIQGALYALALDLPQTRYFLPVLVPVNVLAGIGLSHMASKPFVLPVLVSVLYAWMSFFTLPLAFVLQTTPPPPIQVAEYVKQRFSGENSVVVVARQSHIFLARELNLPVIFPDDPTSESLLEQLENQPAQWVVVVDPEAFRPSWPYREVERIHFQRDKRVHAKHSYVEVEVYERDTDWFPTLPEDGRIDIGSSQDGSFVGLGWYRREDIGGTTARWSGSSGESAFIRFQSLRKISRFEFRAWSFVPNQRVRVDCNGTLIGWFSLSENWSTLGTTLPASCRGERQKIELRFTVAHLRSPRELAFTSDPRRLGIAVDEITIR